MRAGDIYLCAGCNGDMSDWGSEPPETCSSQCAWLVDHMRMIDEEEQ